jgi:cyanophycinase-like exopeptidase
LPADTAILGIDEHTGIAFNLDDGSAEVFGKGVITFKTKGETKTFAGKETLNFSDLKI